MKTFQLGAWTPDAPDLAAGGLIDCKGVYPSSVGYSPFKSAEDSTKDVAGTVLGTGHAYRKGGAQILYIGTSSDLYAARNLSTLGVINASGLAIPSITNGEYWQFEQMGVMMFATCKSGGTFYISDIEGSLTFASTPTTMPSGNAIGRVDDFLIFGDIKDIDSSDQPYRIRWSPFNNPTGTWGTDLATQAGFVDMPAQMGKVTGISGGEVGIIFQKRGISRIDYVGGATAFQKAVISPSIGCESAASIADIKGVRYFLGTDGFAKTDGATVENISRGRVWDWFRQTANMNRLESVQAAINWDQRSVVWNFFQADTTTHNAQIIYNWEQDRWSYALEAYEWLGEFDHQGSFSEGETPYRKVLFGFSGVSLYTFTGTPIAATLTTGEFELNPGGRAFVRGVYPRIENVDRNTTVSLLYRDSPGITKTATTPTAINSVHGYTPCNVDARFFSVSFGLPAAADWDKAHGYIIDADAAGMS